MAKGKRARRYQVFLDNGIDRALQRYIQHNFAPGSRVVSAAIRNAVTWFLKGKGYLKDERLDFLR